MGERKTVPQESKLLEPINALSGYAVDLKNIRHFELAGGKESTYRIALYSYGDAEATYWSYATTEARDLNLEHLYKVTGWKKPGSLQPPQRA